MHLKTDSLGHSEIMDGDPEWLVTAHLTNSRQDIINLYSALKIQENIKRLIAIQTAAQKGNKDAILLLRRIAEGPSMI